MSHLSKDILRVVKQLWKGAKGKGALMKQADLAKEDKIVPREENQERGRNDFLMAWKRTVFAPSVAEFEDAPVSATYRNYGVDIPTPKGGFQSKARSYFQTPVPNLLTLAQEASEQREYMTHEYAARAAMEGNRHKTKIWAGEFLRDIQDFVSEKGIDMAYEQYCLAIDRTSGAPVVTARERLSHEVFDAFWYGHRSILMLHKIEQTVDYRPSLRPHPRRAAPRDHLGDLPPNHPIDLNPGRLGIGPSLLVLTGWSLLTLLPRHVMFSGESHRLGYRQP
ncbi:unnamed protein product [Clonostachys solani]|uniref:Uncharacterized protein n=1 Tax=Clonostachys solani TaxID=160281 RepID=A0A9N9W3N8_9HYPO|nr:unnamed protein product [Clonostachys solani]